MRFDPPHLGAVVLYRFDADESRPGIITRVWGMDPALTRHEVNIQVFLDGRNDDHLLDADEKAIVSALRLMTIIRKAVPRGSSYREWRWPE